MGPGTARFPTDTFSVSDKAFADVPLAENLRRLRSAGFTHLHFSTGWTNPRPLQPDEIGRWAAALEAADVRVLDVHGCHPKSATGDRVDLWADDGSVRQAALDLFESRLHLTRTFGGDAMVYHVPCHVEPTDAVIDRYLDGLARMEPIARELGVAVALENHYLPENDRVALGRAFDRFDGGYIGFTLDPGHALISGNFQWLLSNCLDRLRVLHLNDNDGESDRHWNPFAKPGKADWDAVIGAIANIPYRKPVQLEVAWRRDLHETHEAFLRDAHAAAVRLAQEIAARVTSGDNHPQQAA